MTKSIPEASVWSSGNSGKHAMLISRQHPSYGQWWSIWIWSELHTSSIIELSSTMFGLYLFVFALEADALPRV